MRYVSNRIVSFSIRVNGSDNSVRVNFQACSTGGSSYVTSNKKVIEAMEASDMFGRVYRRAPEFMNEEAPAAKKKTRTARKAAVKVKEVPSVANWQDAAEYLASEFGVSEGSLTTPDSILSKASECGVRFTNINN